MIAERQPITNQQSAIANDSKINNREINNRSSGRPTRRMLTIAAQLDLVARLLAVIAAVLPEWPLWLDGAVAGRVSAFRSSHVDPPLGRLYAS
jgi:hypothetical protein